MKKSGVIVFLFFLGFICGLTSCENFSNSKYLKEQLEKKIAYANAKSFTVRVAADNGTGSIVTGAGDKTVKVSDFINLEFEESDSYKFLYWTAIDKETGADLSDSIKFTPNDKEKTVAEILKEGNILIKPVCAIRPSITDFSPRDVESGVAKNSTIRITFNQKLSIENDLSKISVTVNGENVLRYFKSVFIEENAIVLMADIDNSIPITSGKKIVNVNIPAGLFYITENGEKIELKSDVQRQYTINQNLNIQSKVDFAMTAGSGTLKVEGEAFSQSVTRTYNYGDELEISFDESQSYQFVRWEIKNGGTEENLIVSIADEKLSKTTIKIKGQSEENRNVEIKAVCAERPYVSEFSPVVSAANSSVAKNSPINITFSKALTLTDEDLAKIQITISEDDVKGHFKDPVISGSTVTFAANSENLIDFTNGIKTVRVIIPGDFYYLANKTEDYDGDKIYIGNEVKKSYVINSLTEERTTVNFSAEANTGKITPSGSQQYNYGDKVVIKFEESSTHKFLRWETSDSSKIVIAEPGSKETTVTIKSTEKSGSFIVNAVCVERPAVTAISPDTSASTSVSVPKDSDIEITFNKTLAAENDLSKITVFMDGYSVDEYFETRSISENKVILKSNKDNPLPVTTGTKNILVTVPSDLFYEYGEDKIQIETGVETVKKYKINSTSSIRAQVNFTAANGATIYGSIEPNGQLAYNYNDVIPLKFTEGSQYKFTGWKVENGEGVVRVENLSSKETTVTILDSTAEKEIVKISPICIPYVQVTETEPAPNATGVRKDTIIKIAFDKEINRSLFEAKPQDYVSVFNGIIEMTDNYTAPKLQEDNKTIVISPDFTNAINFGAATSISMTVICSQEIPFADTKDQLSGDYKLTFKMSNTKDTTPPVMAGTVKLAKTVEGLSSEGTLLKNGMNFDGTNHIKNQFAVEASGLDEDSGLSVIRVKARRIETVEGDSVKENEVVLDSKERFDFSYTEAKTLKAMFTLPDTVADGIIQLDVYVVNNGDIENETPVSFVVAKDTSISNIRIFNRNPVYENWKDLSPESIANSIRTIYLKCDEADVFAKGYSTDLTLMLQWGSDPNNLEYESANFVYVQDGFEANDGSWVNIEGRVAKIEIPATKFNSVKPTYLKAIAQDAVGNISVKDWFISGGNSGIPAVGDVSGGGWNDTRGWYDFYTTEEIKGKNTKNLNHEYIYYVYPGAIVDSGSIATRGFAGYAAHNPNAGMISLNSMQIQNLNWTNGFEFYVQEVYHDFSDTHESIISDCMKKWERESFFNIENGIQPGVKIKADCQSLGTDCCTYGNLNGPFYYNRPGKPKIKDISIKDVISTEGSGTMKLTVTFNEKPEASDLQYFISNDVNSIERSYSTTNILECVKSKNIIINLSLFDKTNSVVKHTITYSPVLDTNGLGPTLDGGVSYDLITNRFTQKISSANRFKKEDGKVKYTLYGSKTGNTKSEVMKGNSITGEFSGDTSGTVAVPLFLLGDMNTFNSKETMYYTFDLKDENGNNFSEIEKFSLNYSYYSDMGNLYYQMIDKDMSNWKLKFTATMPAVFDWSDGFYMPDDTIKNVYAIIGTDYGYLKYENYYFKDGNWNALGPANYYIFDLYTLVSKKQLAAPTQLKDNIMKYSLTIKDAAKGTFAKLRYTRYYESPMYFYLGQEKCTRKDYVDNGSTKFVSSDAPTFVQTLYSSINFENEEAWYNLAACTDFQQNASGINFYSPSLADVQSGWYYRTMVVYADDTWQLGKVYQK
ncbi:MAG: hypothetical protein MJ185_08800 [Treponema sp.]|nr:hypothetical protein [Treponema sp.]